MSVYLKYMQASCSFFLVSLLLLCVSHEIILCNCSHDAVDLILLCNLLVLETIVSVNSDLTVRVTCENDWMVLANLDDCLRYFTVYLFAVLVLDFVEMGEKRLKWVDL